MARFEERATKPARGPRDMLRWKLGRNRDPDRDIRPGIRFNLDRDRHGQCLLGINRCRGIVDFDRKVEVRCRGQQDEIDRSGSRVGNCQRATDDLALGEVGSNLGRFES